PPGRPAGVAAPCLGRAEACRRPPEAPAPRRNREGPAVRDRPQGRGRHGPAGTGRLPRPRNPHAPVGHDSGQPRRPAITLHRTPVFPGTVACAPVDRRSHRAGSPPCHDQNYGQERPTTPSELLRPEPGRGQGRLSEGGGSWLRGPRGPLGTTG